MDTQSDAYMNTKIIKSFNLQQNKWNWKHAEQSKPKPERQPPPAFPHRKS